MKNNMRVEKKTAKDTELIMRLLIYIPLLISTFEVLSFSQEILPFAFFMFIIGVLIPILFCPIIIILMVTKQLSLKNSIIALLVNFSSFILWAYLLENTSIGQTFLHMT